VKVGERQKLHVVPKKDIKMQKEALWEEDITLSSKAALLFHDSCALLVTAPGPVRPSTLMPYSHISSQQCHRESEARLWNEFEEAFDGSYKLQALWCMSI
jgi:hypothetical protein